MSGRETGRKAVDDVFGTLDLDPTTANRPDYDAGRTPAWRM